MSVLVQAPSAGPVRVEAVLLGTRGGRLTYRVMQRPLRTGQHPDAVARSLTLADGTTDGGALLHSTSWRYEPGAVVLTYAALPDPDPTDATVLPGPVPGPDADPLAPCRPQVRLDHVVSHACRHLAWLRYTDRVVAERAARVPHLWALIDRYRPAPAGQLAMSVT